MNSNDSNDAPPVVLDRVTTPRGELVLRRSGADFEVISNGIFLMDTRDGRSERLLVSAAAAAHLAPERILLGGLGVGFSLLEAVTLTDPRQIVVVEIEQRIVDWHAGHLHHLTGDALADPRVEVVVADVRAHLDASPGSYDVVCLDVDNGPEWTVTDDNAGLYGAAGLDVTIAALAPGGVLAVWSANRSPAYEGRLRQRLGDVQVLEVERLAGRGDPDVVYLATRPLV
jgi:spermidine synthase